MAMGVTESLYKVGVTGIQFLQTTFPNSDKFFLTVTEISDPSYAFSILFPLAAGLNTGLSANILMVSILGEWSNTLLKWLLMEDRPYWWVRETDVYGEPSMTDSPAPKLRQTPFTCETGPGSPSGHVMGATAITYVVVQWFIEHFVEKSVRYGADVKKKVAKQVWFLFVISMMLVAMSRLYVATHFPHQCLLGFFCGIAVGWLSTCRSSPFTRWWQRSSRPKLLLAALVLSSVSMAAYWLQKVLGIDPQWSVKLAFKWCESSDYLHVNTTPLYSLVRDSGAIFGVALSSPIIRIRKKANPIAGLVGAFILAVAFQMASDAVPTKDVHIFYGCQFMLYAVEPYLLLIVLPIIAALVKAKMN